MRKNKLLLAAVFASFILEIIGVMLILLSACFADSESISPTIKCMAAGLICCIPFFIIERVIR